MVKVLLFGAALLFIAVLLMGVRVFFTKDGKFPNTHVGANKAMRDRGIRCATSQDREMRRRESPVEKILESEK
ncbi:MAG TPA: hypothetical protein GXZ56_10475 [Bacteroidales bacterium]|jgi:hypothetical protein|nr:hypothetical protein [Bacteroidales bacterium]